MLSVFLRQGFGLGFIVNYFYSEPEGPESFVHNLLEPAGFFAGGFQLNKYSLPPGEQAEPVRDAGVKYGGQFQAPSPNGSDLFGQALLNRGL